MGELRLPSVPESVPQVRAFVHEQLAQVLDDDALYDVLVATTEAAGNAVNHGGLGEQGTITTSCDALKDKVIITIKDEGRGFEPAQIESAMPDAMSTGGRGLVLVQALMDSLKIASGPRGTLLTMERAITG
ncbi:MAG: serine/threonine-protein kinase RsbW [Actinomycetota bacterium]|jgi:serine/threonine-protein kinase RsbW|nr:serine/threonine-protein kinase RsbW [Actinomycetota bacterium]